MKTDKNAKKLLQSRQLLKAVLPSGLITVLMLILGLIFGSPFLWLSAIMLLETIFFLIFYTMGRLFARLKEAEARIEKLEKILR